ncbi:hypothetical protein K438DRAFT_1788307 [Mycena galopus ATCC 62051]|nr:hypothetical protein K438DRAFT_1788307 [Mycena galopus ATCC 62051]
MPSGSDSTPLSRHSVVPPPMISGAARSHGGVMQTQSSPGAAAGMLESQSAKDSRSLVISEDTHEHEASPPRLPPTSGVGLAASLSKLHYATRVKPKLEAIWAEAKRTVPETEHVSMSQDFTRNCWEKEDTDFKQEIENHRDAIQKWKASRKIPEGSAEEYNKAMDSLNEVAIPMADALAEHLGSHVVILVVGPVGSEKGEGFFGDGSLTDKKDMGPVRLRGFSEGECRARAWPPLDVPAPALNDLLSMDDVGSSSAPPPTTLSPAARPATVTPARTAPQAPAPAPPQAPAPGPPLTATPASTVAPTPVAEDKIDCSEWPESLVHAHAYLAEKKWGPDWTALLNALVRHEWSLHFCDDDGKLPELRSRPQEFADWMKQHRVMKDYTIGKDFGAKLYEWWKGEEEPGKKNVSQNVDNFESWSMLRSRGRNGPVLLILGLAWWGQTICNAAANDGLGAGEAALMGNRRWRLLLNNIRWVLEEILPQDRVAIDGEEEVGGTETAAKETGKEKDKKTGAKTNGAPKKTAKEKGKKTAEVTAASKVGKKR